MMNYVQLAFEGSVFWWIISLFFLFLQNHFQKQIIEL